jgi:hypothetical protein
MAAQQVRQVLPGVSFELEPEFLLQVLPQPVAAGRKAQRDLPVEGSRLGGVELQVVTQLLVQGGDAVTRGAVGHQRHDPAAVAAGQLFQVLGDQGLLVVTVQGEVGITGGPDSGRREGMPVPIGGVHAQRGRLCVETAVPGQQAPQGRYRVARLRQPTGQLGQGHSALVRGPGREAAPYQQGQVA